MNKPLIIDVRTEEEYAMGFFPGAINIPLDKLEGEISKIGDKDREITLYCASGGRSEAALQFLYGHGYSNLKNGGGLMHMMARAAQTA